MGEGGMMTDIAEVGAVNQVDEKHMVIITDCKVYIDQVTRSVMFEFLLDVGEGAETRTQGWHMCQLWGKRGEQVPGWDYVRGSGEITPCTHGESLLDLCEAIDIDYEDLMNDRVSMETIIGNEVACSIGEKEIVNMSDIYHDYSWDEEIRRLWGFMQISELSTMPVPD
jgi:hypothetical protein